MMFKSPFRNAVAQISRNKCNLRYKLYNYLDNRQQPLRPVRFRCGNGQSSAWDAVSHVTGMYLTTILPIATVGGVPVAEIYDPRPVFYIAPIPTHPLRHNASYNDIHKPQ